MSGRTYREGLHALPGGKAGSLVRCPAWYIMRGDTLGRSGRQQIANGAAVYLTSGPHAIDRTGTPWLGLVRAHKGPVRPVQMFVGIKEEAFPSFPCVPCGVHEEILPNFGKNVKPYPIKKVFKNLIPLFWYVIA